MADAQALVDYATQPAFLATPYIDHSTLTKWGPGYGWDCSAFTAYVMKKFGVNLPASSDAQYRMGVPVARNKLRPGDLVFYHTDPNKVTGHVGIYIGNGNIVNAANPRSGTRVQSVDSPGPYVGARRVLNIGGTAQAGIGGQGVNTNGRDDSFYGAVLSGIGAPVNAVTLSVMRAWQAAEGGSAAWNPFNTTQAAKGATSYNYNNGHPVKNYVSREQGIAATIATLNLHYYDAIRSALKASNPTGAIAAIVASPWGGHYHAPRSSGGAYQWAQSSIYNAWHNATGGKTPQGAAQSTDGMGPLPAAPSKPAYAGGLPADLISGDGSGGTAQYDPNSGALIAPNGQIFFPYTLWVARVPLSARRKIAVVSVPGAYKRAGASLDPGQVTEVTPGTVAGDVLSGLAPITGLFSWVSDNMARIGLALLGIFIIVIAVIYANKGTIAETAKTATKVAAVV